MIFTFKSTEGMYEVFGLGGGRSCHGLDGVVQWVHLYPTCMTFHKLLLGHFQNYPSVTGISFDCCYMLICSYYHKIIFSSLFRYICLHQNDVKNLFTPWKLEYDCVWYPSLYSIIIWIVINYCSARCACKPLYAPHRRSSARSMPKPNTLNPILLPVFLILRSEHVEECSGDCSILLSWQPYV